MSKPDQTGGSLEDILSSIRKSLAEQSTDALEEVVPGSQAGDSRQANQRKDGLVGRLANANAGLPPGPKADVREDDLSDVLEVGGSPARAVAQPAVVPPAEPVSAPAPEKDPLWFLSRSAAPATPEPVLTPPEVVRATMPPFFGASGDATKPEAAPADSAVVAAKPLFATAGPEKMADPALAREVSLVAAAAETAARPAGSVPPPAAAAAGRAEAPAAPGSLQGQHALEAMVLELLKPMLRQWLDQNMPRMVAEALKAEADKSSASDTAKKP